MTIQECVRAVRSRWWVVVLAAVLGLGAAFAVEAARPPEYTAELRMYAAAQTGDDAGAATQGEELAAQRVSFYTQLVTSARVTGAVVQQLGVDGEPDDLAAQITATEIEGTVFFDLAVTDPSPERAAELVNTVARVLTDVVAEVERGNSPGGIPLVAIEALEEASVPAEPSSTGQLVTLALGLLSGIALGIGATLAVTALDPSIRSAAQLAQLAGVPVLGAIARDKRMPDTPLPVRRDARGPVAEEFRKLRTTLQVGNAEGTPSTILVTSPMPGAGKTTTVLNLGIALALAGERVLVVEADLRKPVMGELLELTDTPGLSSVLRGRATVAQAVQEWDGLLRVLACGPLPPNPSELLASRTWREVLEEIRGDVDVVLIDTPPLLPVADAAAIAPAVDGVVLVCEYRRTTRAEVTAALEVLQGVSVEPLGTVLMKVPESMSPAYSKDSSRYRGSTSVPAQAVAVDARRPRVPTPPSPAETSGPPAPPVPVTPQPPVAPRPVPQPSTPPTEEPTTAIPVQQPQVRPPQAPRHSRPTGPRHEVPPAGRNGQEDRRWATGERPRPDGAPAVVPGGRRPPERQEPPRPAPRRP